jgi:DNA-binding transcriptional LysR family regulator
MRTYGKSGGSSAEAAHSVGGVDVTQIRYFLAAAEHLNYGRAASALGVSPSTLSRQVRHLEDRLGVSVFERNRHGIHLTAAGRHFQTRAQHFMFEFDRAVTRASRAGRAEIGDLYLGVAPSILVGPLQRFLGLCRRKLPDVDVHCVEAEHAGLVSALHERRPPNGLRMATQSYGVEASPSPRVGIPLWFR